MLYLLWNHLARIPRALHHDNKKKRAARLPRLTDYVVFFSIMQIAPFRLLLTGLHVELICSWTNDDDALGRTLNSLQTYLYSLSRSMNFHEENSAQLKRVEQQRFSCAIIGVKCCECQRNDWQRFHRLDTLKGDQIHANFARLLGRLQLPYTTRRPMFLIVHTRCRLFVTCFVL